MKQLKTIIALFIILSMFTVAVAETESVEMRPMVGEATDYSLAENWLHLPAITKAVDTIYLYPTTYMNPEEDAPEICPIDDPIARTTEATL